MVYKRENFFFFLKRKNTKTKTKIESKFDEPAWPECYKTSGCTVSRNSYKPYHVSNLE
jgi:hypothetical protein